MNEYVAPAGTQKCCDQRFSLGRELKAAGAVVRKVSSVQLPFRSVPAGHLMENQPCLSLAMHQAARLVQTPGTQAEKAPGNTNANVTLTTERDCADPHSPALCEL